jgi:hypothetical protein
MTGQKSFGGPAKREPKQGERVALSLRMTPDLKRKLDAAAEAGGRSQSQEAEFRLERSFEREALLSEVLTLAYSEEVAGILIMLGMVIDDTTLVLKQPREKPRSEDQAFQLGIRAAIRVLEAFLPSTRQTAEDIVPQDPAVDFVARDVIKTVLDDGGGNLFGLPANRIRTLLGKRAANLRRNRP